MSLPHKISTLLYCFNAADEVLLLERAQEPNRGLWSPPGGKLKTELGESPYACACREAREELGLQLTPADLHLTGLISEHGYAGQAHWLMFLLEVKPKLHAVPPPMREGRFCFHSRAALDALQLPQTDREQIWPLFWQHRGGFFAAHCHCHRDGRNEWTLETCRPKASTFVPNEEQRRMLLHDSVFYEILYAFGVSLYELTDYCAWEHVNFSRMGHARALYDFFETPTASRKQDDAVSEDYGFSARPVTRPSDDRKRLNKDLFHLSYARLRHTKATKAWPDTILSCLHDRCIDFIRHLLAHKSQFDTANHLAMWETLLGALTSGREIHISRPFLVTDVSPNQEISLDRLLPGGLGALTKPAIRAEETLDSDCKLLPGEPPC